MEQAKFLNRQINQAYEEVPWRRQQRTIGWFLLCVVAIALVAVIYLTITSQAATIGREIQEMQVRLAGHVALEDAALAPDTEEETIPIEELKIQIANLETQLAELTTRDVMAERARKLGFQPIEAGDVLYVEVPGYAGRSTAMLAPPPERVTVNSPVLPQAYRESLFEWLSDEVAKSWYFRSPADLLFKGVQP